MKKITILIIVLTTSISCSKYLSRSELDMCDCLYGYELINAEHYLSEPNVLKKMHRKIKIPKGTYRFWYSCGKSMNYINWKKKLYIYKIGDMDYRIIVINNRVFTISEYDENLNSGLIIDSSIIARWQKNQFYLIFKQKRKKNRSFEHMVFFKDATHIGVVTFDNPTIKAIDIKEDIENFDYRKINKIDRSIIHYQNKKRWAIRNSDCGWK